MLGISRRAPQWLAAPLSTIQLQLRAGHTGVSLERHGRKRQEKAYKPDWRPQTDAHRNVTVTPHCGARTVELNRTAASNALNYKLLRQIRRTLVELEENPAVQIIILKGSKEDLFSSGADFKALYHKAKNPATRDQALLYYREEYYLANLLATYSKPIVSCHHGVSLGSANSLAMNCAYRYGAHNSIVSFPETGLGLTPSAGSSYFLSRLGNGVGMYLGLTGAALCGDEAYWSGFTELYAPHNMLATDLPEHAGEIHSFPYWDQVMERDPIYQKNLSVLREARGHERYQFILQNMPPGSSKESLDDYVVDKAWYASFGQETAGSMIADSDDEGEEYEIPMDNNEKGDLFDFGAGPEVDGRDYHIDPLARDVQTKNLLGCTSAHYKALASGLLDEGPSEEAAARFAMVQRCFGGDVDQGDPVLTISAAPVRERRSRDAWIEQVRSRELSSTWEADFPVPISNIVTDVYVLHGIVPQESELNAITNAVRAAVPRSWPLGTIDDVHLDDLCHEFKVPDRRELYDVVQGAITLTTARVHNIPPGPLIDPEVLARRKQERDDSRQRLRHFDEDGDELSPRLALDPASMDIDDLFYYARGTEEDPHSIDSLKMLDPEEALSRIPIRVPVDDNYDPLQENSLAAAAERAEEIQERVVRYMKRRGWKASRIEKAYTDHFTPTQRRSMQPADRWTEDFFDWFERLAPPKLDEGSLFPSDASKSSTPDFDHSRYTSRAYMAGEEPVESTGSALDDELTLQTIRHYGTWGASQEKQALLSADFDETDIDGSSSSGKIATPGQELALDDDDDEDDDDESLAAAYSKYAPLKRKEDVTRSSNKAQASSDTYNEIIRDPVALTAALGLPRQADVLSTSQQVAQAFKDEDVQDVAVSHPRSVEEIYRRLRAEDTPVARSTISALDTRSPLALKATHKLILDASTSRSREKCYKNEFRVLSRLMFRDDTLAALESYQQPTRSWAHADVESVSEKEVEELFAPVENATDLFVPLRGARQVTEAREEELEAWRQSLEQYYDSGEAHGVLGDVMKKRYTW